MQPEVLSLSAYPLSQRFQDSLAVVIGQPYQRATLGDLRELKPATLILTLWRMRPDRLILPLEDENSTALLPIVRLIAGFTRAHRIEIVGPDLRVVQVSRLGTLIDVARFVGASISSAVRATLSAAELRSLLKKPRIAVAADDSLRRVLYLKTNLWMGIKAGGSIGHIAGVINGLHQAGYGVTFASAEPPVMVDPAVKLLHVAPPATFGMPYGLNNYRFQASFARAASQVLRTTPFGIIYQRLSAANYLGVVLSRRFKLPLVVEYNGSETWIARNWGRAMSFNGLATMAEEAMLAHAHLVVTISDVLRDELIARGVAPDRIVTYPNCIDPEVFDPERFSPTERNALRARYGITPDSQVAAFIGTFGQWHGAEVLAQAIAKLALEQRDWVAKHKCHFMLIGDGPKMKDVQLRIEQAGASDICTITGLVPQAEAPLHLASADYLISPHVANADGSKFFGSPTKLFEYMAMAKGIYGSRLDQIEHVLSPSLDVLAVSPDLPGPSSDDDSTAILGQPGDVDALVEGIKFLVERPDWARHLARNARAKALSQYTWAHHVGAILDAFGSLPANESTTRPDARTPASQGRRLG
ncbi:hypothetical protein JP75_20880 [Devosia riboflavina]|uniref:Glycosyltransferase subfamily 4-like N-terminal domain-containing protein n=1 Tax=Devosia riboflavina TaxID=46914 RepID=A0A087LXR0_9HYPH|nr:glycosyltransferase [Devosia riboflavina]KFL29413.1 hypothetical protein JP75_20880 [Devosia riboflavina]